MILLPLSACQFNQHSLLEPASFGQYYLWIKSLTPEELQQEIQKQKLNKREGYQQADVYLLLLYSLPKSPIHNPYTAKALLNTYQLEAYSGSLFNTADLGLVVLLKDQLNQQLLSIGQQLAMQNLQQETQTKLEHKKKKNQELETKLMALTQQINQLKSIEKTLNERGQE